MWLKREEYERLVTQAAQLKPTQNALAIAEERAMSAEDALAVERNRKDWLVEQLTSRFLVKQKAYGLDHEPHPVESPTKSSHPKGWIREPDEIDLAKLEYYKQCYRDAGLDVEKAESRWEAEMRGETVPFEYEMSETEQ